MAIRVAVINDERAALMPVSLHQLDGKAILVVHPTAPPAAIHRALDAHVRSKRDRVHARAQLVALGLLTTTKESASDGGA